MTSYTVEPEVLAALWTALQEPHRAAGTQSEAVAGIVDRGWAFEHQVEDFLILADNRITRHRLEETLLSPLDFVLTSVCHRPGAKQSGVSAFPALRAAELGAFCIMLERMGFEVDPSPFARLIVPTLPRVGGIISSDELSLLWFEKTRHKRPPIALSVEKRPSGALAIENLVTGSGYKVEYVSLGGQPWTLTVSAPRYRRRREPVETVCPKCGWTWWRGDPESSANHRAEHKKRMRILAPVQLSVDRLEGLEDGMLTVRSWSPRWMHAEMVGRAFAFKREMGFDFVQWGYPIDTDLKAHGLLFVDAEIITGAAAFRCREAKSGQPIWGLQWIWVAPRFRRTGVLNRRWAALRRRFGAFHVEPPVSDAMCAFLRDHGDESLLEWPTKRE